MLVSEELGDLSSTGDWNRRSGGSNSRDRRSQGRGGHIPHVTSVSTRMERTEHNSRINDAYFLSSHDHTGLRIVNTMFDGSNYFAWSQAVRRAQK